MLALAVRRPRAGPARIPSAAALAAAAVRLVRPSAGIAGALVLVAFAPLAIPDLFAEARFGVPSAVAMQHSTLAAVGFGLVTLSAYDLAGGLAGLRRTVGRLAAGLLAVQAVVTGFAWAVAPVESVVGLVTVSPFAIAAAGLLALAHAGRLSSAFGVSTLGLVASALVPVDGQIGLVGRLIALAIGFGFAVGAIALRDRSR
jgi:hypothetical protein